MKKRRNELERLLGAMPDAKLAKMFGIPKGRVQYLRRSRRIPAFDQARSVQPGWGKKEVQMLGKMSDERVGLLTGRTQQSVRRARILRGIPARRPQNDEYRWSSKHVAMLGEKPDVEIASHLGVSVHVVRHKRRSLGIPRFLKG